MKIGRLAPWYRWIEYAAFGRALERRRFAFLDRAAGARHVLILGEGDGRVLERLLTIAPEAHFDVIDVSPEMIALARRRTGDSNRVRFVCGDARTIAWPDAHYDAALMLFFLDCFTELDARGVIGRIAASLTPNGVWLVSDFAIPTSGWRHWHARLWIGTMYRFFQVTTGLEARKLPPIERLLAEAGMRRIERQEERAGMMYSELLTRRS
jgi:ubiquinone/menaquinone biosynthesis C-methylase UbiE